MEYFNQSIQQHFGRLSEDELEIVRSYFKREKLKKNDFFTKADKICDKLSLVKSGIMRVFALSDGKEITHWLCTENFIFTDVELNLR